MWFQSGVNKGRRMGASGGSAGGCSEEDIELQTVSQEGTAHRNALLPLALPSSVINSYCFPITPKPHRAGRSLVVPGIVPGSP